MVQDDSREIVLARMCGLSRASSRKGVDALLGDAPFELKSTTTSSVSTARDAGMRHVDKWRRQYWIIGRGAVTKRAEEWRPSELYFAHPADLEPFFASVEGKIRNLVDLFKNAVAGNNMPDDKMTIIAKVIETRVGTLNCPSMTMAFVRRRCHKVRLRDSDRHVLDLVRNCPL